MIGHFALDVPPLEGSYVCLFLLYGASVSEGKIGRQRDRESKARTGGRGRFDSEEYPNSERKSDADALRPISSQLVGVKC